MLKIENLVKRYGTMLAVNNLSMEIKKGEVFGFVGSNGAGKTTTMRVVAGLLQPTSGLVYIDGIEAIANPEMVKEKIGYMPDFFGVYDNLKAMEYMEFYASMYGMVGKEVTNTCMDLLEIVNLKDEANEYVDGLSRGMKQRLCLARCLVHNPEFLILDEPASGLDPRASFEMKEIIENLSSMGKTIMISSHILSELAKMCTSIGIMKSGQMIAQGSIDDILLKAGGNGTIRIKVLEGEEKAIDILKETVEVKKISILENEIVVAFSGDEKAEAMLIKKLIDEDILLNGFYKESGSLEQAFLELTEENKEVSL